MILLCWCWTFDRKKGSEFFGVKKWRVASDERLVAGDFLCARKIAHGQGDGLADDDDVDEQLNSERDRIKWPFADRGQGNHCKIHEEVNQNTEEGAAYDRVVDQKRNDAAGSVKNSRSYQRNEEVERNSQERDFHSPLEGIGTQDAAGDELKKAHEIAFGKAQCGKPVENAADEPRGEDDLQRGEQITG